MLLFYNRYVWPKQVPNYHFPMSLVILPDIVPTSRYRRFPTSRHPDICDVPTPRHPDVGTDFLSPEIQINLMKNLVVLS